MPDTVPANRRESSSVTFCDAASSPEERFLVDLARVLNGHGVEWGPADPRSGVRLALQGLDGIDRLVLRVRSSPGARRSEAWRPRSNR